MIPSWSGRRILVTRPKGAATGLVRRLRAKGAHVLAVPAIGFDAPADLAPFEAALGRLETFDWVVFTSARGVQATASRLRRLRRTFPRVRVAVVGPATKRAAVAAGIPVSFEPTRALTKTLGEELPLRKESKVLLLRAEVASAALVRALGRKGAAVEDVACYRTRPLAASEGPARRAVSSLSAADWILFTSPSTVDALCALLGPRHLPRARRARIASIGPVTSAAARRRGFAIATEATLHTSDGIVDAIEEATRTDA